MRVASVSVLFALLVACPALAQTQLTVTAVNKLRTERNKDLHSNGRRQTRVFEGRLSCLRPLRARAF